MLYHHLFGNYFDFQNVFMAMSIDTYDAESGIHPRNKRLVSERLSFSGLNLAYGKTNWPTNGPFPISVEFVPGKETVKLFSLI